jgi:protein SDA1
MLFAMVERGMEGEITGNKGKAKAGAAASAERQHGGEAMWAVILTKELWKKGIW